MSHRLDGLTEERLGALASQRIVERIWQRDPSVWGGTPDTPEIADRLGWLTVIDAMRSEIARLRGLARDVARRFDRVVLLGMGGSSLAPVVLHAAHEPRTGAPEFQMLDSIHPSAVRAVEATGPLDRTLFVVASKSGTTIETQSLLQYFWHATGKRADQFVAITDGGTPLAALASSQGFLDLLVNPSDIGGRYSALSLFGLAPAALVGVDPEAVLDGASDMVRACGRTTELSENPGAVLGAWIGGAALDRRDKLAIDLPGDLAWLGMWIEQLVAESTGKDGRGILPVLDMTGVPRSEVAEVRYERAAKAAALAGETLRLAAARGPQVGAEFFRWEFATALACSMLGVNPFDQPNVAESKRNTLDVLERGGAGQAPRPVRRRAIEAFQDGVRPGDYVAVCAWLPPSPEHDRRLRELQSILAERLGVVVTVGYGPRFLHSTGQLHKGGPPTGHFVQLLEPVGSDLPIPGAPYSFGRLLAAQAEGDRHALRERGRPVLQVDNLTHFLETV